ncbi:MAG: N-acetylmuramoyl-L-alanine amidase, partial [Deltaproteobacteria bacterium]|nr:N-acetylmuramoyl-L-alanine amidase [Deltaproteobacteria bacterium]
MVDQMKQWIKRIVITMMVLVFATASTAIAQPSQGKHQVIVDAGHGGKDPGVKLTDKFNEKEITLSIALMLKKELDKSGNIHVLLTRSSDMDVSVSERMKTIS